MFQRDASFFKTHYEFLGVRSTLRWGSRLDKSCHIFPVSSKLFQAYKEDFVFSEIPSWPLWRATFFKVIEVVRFAERTCYGVGQWLVRGGLIWLVQRKIGLILSHLILMVHTSFRNQKRSLNRGRAKSWERLFLTILILVGFICCKLLLDHLRVLRWLLVDRDLRCRVVFLPFIVRAC